MKADKLLSSLCYFSVLFAPFLFPIIIYILTSGKVRHHAGKALWTHFVPYLSCFIGVWFLVLNAHDHSAVLLIVCIFTAFVLYYLILNFVRGIKVLIES